MPTRAPRMEKDDIASRREIYRRLYSEASPEDRAIINKAVGQFEDAGYRNAGKESAFEFAFAAAIGLARLTEGEQG